MKTLRLVSLLPLVACLFGTASADEAKIRAAVSDSIGGVNIREINKTPVEGLYEVVLNGFDILYVDGSGKYALQGNLMELKTRTSLTAKRVEALQHIDFSTLPLDRAIVKTKGNGARKLAVFSDPDCPYCQQLERELREIDNVTIYTFLLPLTEIHPDAARKARLVWCAEDKAKAWEDLMLRRKEPAGKGECDTPIEQVAGIAGKHFINGTPAMVFASGKLVPGVVPWQKLDPMLDVHGK